MVYIFVTLFVISLNKSKQIKMFKNIPNYLLFIAALLITACSDDDENNVIAVPDTFEFTRDGQTTVSFSGQTDRLNMLSEVKSYVKQGDAGGELDAAVLQDMYSNENDAFEAAELNASTKQLESKTFLGDVQMFKDLFVAAETASIAGADGVQAEEGVAGLIERQAKGTTILVNEKGWEFTQFIEKGLMGAVFYHQIFNVYMTDDRVGDDVENIALVDGKNYTPMEHHWDEAFGYWGVPLDFPAGEPILESDEDRFWATYTIDRDVIIEGLNETMMNAYLAGRTAIVNNQFDIKNESREIIYEWHEIVAAATTIHYINESLDNLAEGDTGSLFHHLSEAYAFLKAISYSPKKKLNDQEIDQILNTDFGTDTDFWTVTETGLQRAKATIAAKYTQISGIEDVL